MRVSFKKIINHATRGRDFILDIIFPANCVNCGREGGWLCQRCSRELQFSPAQHCLHCNRRTKFGEFCPRCSAKFYLNGVWTAGDYENEIIASLIKNLKYKFIKNISTLLGDYTSLFLSNLIKLHAFNNINYDLNSRTPEQAKLPDIFLEFKKSLIIPVPLHKKRLNWRGFNQSRAIANIIADKLNLEIDNKNLIRKINTRPQVKFKEAERKKNIQNSFFWQGNNLRQKNIIIFDDIATTGATLNECAKVLKNAGAKEIWGLAIAKG